MTAAIFEQLQSEGYTSVSPETFDPPLKRKAPTVPGYWTVEEIAAEIGTETRKVHYAIKGRRERNQRAFLKAFKIDRKYLVPDQDALRYILENRGVGHKAA